MIGSNVSERAPDERLDIRRCLGFVTVNLIGIISFIVYAVIPIITGTGVPYAALAVMTFLYFERMFYITGFYHRYFSHRSYQVSRPWQFIFAILGMTALQKGPIWWASHHRHHHRHSDTEEDVHSCFLHGLWWSHIGWLVCKRYETTNEEAVRDLQKYPELRFMEGKPWVYLPAILLAVACYGFGWIFAKPLHTSANEMLFLGFFTSTFVLYHGTFSINSFAHLFGSVRYQTGEKSKNNFFLALITLGEGWHNNHHHRQGQVNQGETTFEKAFDWTLLRLKVMHVLRIVRLPRNTKL